MSIIFWHRKSSERLMSDWHELFVLQVIFLHYASDVVTSFPLLWCLHSNTCEQATVRRSRLHCVRLDARGQVWAKQGLLPQSALKAHLSQRWSAAAERTLHNSRQCHPHSCNWLFFSLIYATAGLYWHLQCVRSWLSSGCINTHLAYSINSWCVPAQWLDDGWFSHHLFVSFDTASGH
jgi:hypothetical protein